MLAPGTLYSIEVNPRIPERLARLEELADNLWYSWDGPTRELFERLQPALWSAVGQSPKAFLKRIDERRLIEAAADPVFLSNFGRILSAYDAYHALAPRLSKASHCTVDDLVAYFCAEFGFHESLPIYSGGLGILAGDHCKAASDLRLPFVGVGLLYRQGYFFQTIDSQRQPARRRMWIRISPICRSRWCSATTAARFESRSSCRDAQVVASVWRARAGCVDSYLLDTDVEENSEHDRNIAHRLYGGDRSTRIEQEIVLGIGGVRALAALGLQAHGLAHQRRARGIPDPGAPAQPDAAGPGFCQRARGCRGEHGVYHAYRRAGGA